MSGCSLFYPVAASWWQPRARRRSQAADVLHGVELHRRRGGRSAVMRHTYPAVHPARGPGATAGAKEGVVCHPAARPDTSIRQGTSLPWYPAWGTLGFRPVRCHSRRRTAFHCWRASLRSCRCSDDPCLATHTRPRTHTPRHTTTTTTTTNIRAQDHNTFTRNDAGPGLSSAGAAPTTLVTLGLTRQTRQVSFWHRWRSGWHDAGGRGRAVR